MTSIAFPWGKVPPQGADEGNAEGLGTVVRESLSHGFAVPAPFHKGAEWCAANRPHRLPLGEGAQWAQRPSAGRWGQRPLQLFFKFKRVHMTDFPHLRPLLCKDGVGHAVNLPARFPGGGAGQGGVVKKHTVLVRDPA